MHDDERPRRSGIRGRSLILALLVAASGSLALSPAMADEAAEAILKKTEALRQPRSSIQHMTMVVTSRKGKEQTRSLIVKTRVDGQSVFTLAEVSAPEDVAGTRFLSREVPGQPGELYLYLPRLNRTSKMLAKRAALLGSDFAAAEMDFSAWADADHKLLGQETLEIGGEKIETDVIESVAKDPDKADYPRSKLWLARSDGYPRRIEFQEQDGTVVKRWTIFEVASSNGTLYPKRSVMETIAKGSQTELRLEEVKMDVPASELPDALFDPENLGGAKAPSDAPAEPAKE